MKIKITLDIREQGQNQATQRGMQKNIDALDRTIEKLPTHHFDKINLRDIRWILVAIQKQL